MTKQTKIFISVVLSCTLLLILFLPSFAADEPSEGGQSSAPTNLSGTTWTVPGGWVCSSGYGFFSIEGNVTMNFANGNSSNYSFDSLGLGSKRAESLQYFNINATPNAISVWNTPTSYNTWVGNSTSFTFNFIGGSDVTNSALISWLMSYGTWTNPPLEPPPSYTIQPNYYQIKLQPDMIPDDVGFYEYGGQFIYEGETYRSLRFSRVSSLLTNVYLYDDDGNQIVIKGQTASNDGWFSGRNIILVSSITTENEDAYTYFTENLSATEQSPFDLFTYIISGFFKALDNFYLFFDFSLLDLIFVMCGLLGAIWFLKLLAGG